MARPRARHLTDSDKLHVAPDIGSVVRYEEIEHTADVGIRAYGQTLDELFVNAAEGMFGLVAELSAVKPIGELEVRLTADDVPTLLVRWLTELLFVHETQHLLFASFDVKVDGTSVLGHARGEAIDKTRHELKLAIKAVTRHRLTVDPERGIAEVIFDI
jgi:SHS2 domain-containing protein